MLELNIKCDSHDEARVYLNAHAYHNLLSDLLGALMAARKHSSKEDVLYQVEHFLPDLAKAVEHSLGAY